jgi:hypothetical protein
MMRRYNRWHLRFDQPDPNDFSYNLADPQGFNRYAYTEGDPTNFVDPSGLEMCYDAWCGGGGLSWGGGYSGGNGWGHDPSPGQRGISEAEDAWYNRMLKAFAKAGSRRAFEILEGVLPEDDKVIIDCVRFTEIVQEIADSSDSPEVFLNRLARVFTGPTIAASGRC